MHSSGVNAGAEVLSGCGAGAQGTQEAEEGGSGDSSGNASQTRLAETDNDLHPDVPGVSGRSVDRGQSGDPTLGPSTRSEQTLNHKLQACISSGQQRGCSTSPEAHTAPGNLGGNSGSRGNSSEASREGTPQDDRGACLARRDYSRFTIKRSPSTRHNSSSSARQNNASQNASNGAAALAAPSNGESRGVGCSAVGPAVSARHSYRGLGPADHSEGQGEQASAPVQRHADKDSGDPPSLRKQHSMHAHNNHHAGYGSGFARWASGGAEGLPGSSHISSSIMPPQKPGAIAESVLSRESVLFPWADAVDLPFAPKSFFPCRLFFSSRVQFSPGVLLFLRPVLLQED
jgi:hypothetical protein